MDVFTEMKSLQDARQLLCLGLFEGSYAVDKILTHAREYLALQIDAIARTMLGKEEQQ